MQQPEPPERRRPPPKSLIRWLWVIGGVYFVGVIFAGALPDSIGALALVQGRSTKPMYWYSFLTYSVVHNGVLHWIKVMALTTASLAVLEPRLPGKDLIVILIGSSVVGGTTYMVAATGGGAVIGGGIVGSGLAGAVFGTWLRQRRTFSRPAYAYACVIAVVILGTVFFGTLAQDRGMLAAAIASTVYAGVRATSLPRGGGSRLQLGSPGP